jgi:hypothetical protein
MFIVSVVLVVPETPVLRLRSSTVATVVSSGTSSTCSRRLTRKFPVSLRASLAKVPALAVVVAVVVAVEAVAAAMLLLAMSVAWAEVAEVVLASAAEAGAAHLKAAMEVDMAARPLAVTLLPLVELTAVAAVVVVVVAMAEAMVTHQAPAATPGGRSTARFPRHRQPKTLHHQV